jgi:hypothetical protein
MSFYKIYKNVLIHFNLRLGLDTFFLFYFINIIIVCLHSDESDISDYAQID